MGKMVVLFTIQDCLPLKVESTHHDQEKFKPSSPPEALLTLLHCLKLLSSFESTRK